MTTFKLKHFFLCVALLVILISSWVAYAWRRNSPHDIVEDGNDIYAPYYATPKSQNMEHTNDEGHRTGMPAKDTATKQGSDTYQNQH